MKITIAISLAIVAPAAPAARGRNARSCDSKRAAFVTPNPSTSKSPTIDALRVEFIHR